MTFPTTPIDTKVELLLSGVWTDITADVMVRDGISITRGGGPENGTASPSQCTLMVNNRAGKYSPRNPLGPYYGSLGMNTQLRVTVEGVRRFWGEISELPPRWDTSTKDAYVPIVASGILRRINQGNQPSISGLGGFYRSTTPVTYWPLDDGTESTQGAVAAGTYQSSKFKRGSAGEIAVREWGVGFLASYLAPTLRINDTNPAAGTDRMIGVCRGSDSTPDAVAFDMVWKIDTEIIPNGGMVVYPAGSFHINFYLSNGIGWDLSFRHDGSNDDIDLTGSTGSLGSTAALTAIQDTLLHHLRFKAVQNGANVDITIYVDGVSVLTVTENSVTLTATDSISVTYDRASNTTDALLNIGHLIVWENAANIPSIVTSNGLAHGFLGEAAGRRFERLCGSAGNPFVSIGNLDDTLAMGLQYEDAFPGQILEIEQTDGGLIYEDRASLALGYQTRTSLYNQSAAVTLNFTALELSDPFAPTDDDRYVRNDVFGQRREGGSYQATLSSGRLSVQDPPNGVGRYKDEVQVNVETDDDLPPVAGWLLGLGTVDEARYPQISVDRAFPAIVAKPTLSAALLAADVGDRLVVTAARPLGVYDDISQLIVGYTETIEPYSHRLSFNCVPESPWQVNVLDDSTARIDPGDGSTLNSGITSTATSLSVASSGFLWSTAGGDYPLAIKIGGEEMTLTAVSGASSPQTFTATRSVNGVVKSHSTGAVVRLKRPGVVAL